MQNESVVVKFWAGNPRNNLMVNTYTLNAPQSLLMQPSIGCGYMYIIQGHRMLY